MNRRDIDWPVLMQPTLDALDRDGVLPRLDSKHGHRLRFGSKGSLAVDLQNGRWYSFEADQGGYPKSLIVFLARRNPYHWAEDHRIIDPLDERQHRRTKPKPRPKPEPPPNPDSGTSPSRSGQTHSRQQKHPQQPGR